jgi:predicted dehydrogenase
MLGKIISIGGQFCINLNPGDNFRYSKELSGGGALRDLGTHIIDLFRFLVGEITSIDGVIENMIYKTEVEDYAAGIVKFEKGSIGFFNVAFSVPKAFNRIEIVGSKGSLSIDNLIAGRFLSSARMTILLDGEAKKAFRKRGNKQLRLLKSVNKSFLNNTEPEVTGYDGYINLKLMEEFEQKCYSVKS